MSLLWISFQIIYCTIAISAVVQGAEVSLEDGEVGRAIKVVTNVNTSLTLTCSVSDNGSATWSYRRSRESASELLIIEENDLLISNFSDRYEASGTNLIIKNVEARDEGLYECRIFVQGDLLTGRGVYHLIVEIPPSTPECDFPDGLFLEIGSEAYLTCISEAPNVNYAWFKNNQPLSGSEYGIDSPFFNDSKFRYSKKDGIFVFEEVEAEDAGLYDCEVTNDFGTSPRCPALILNTKSISTNITSITNTTTAFEGSAPSKATNNYQLSYIIYVIITGISCLLLLFLIIRSALKKTKKRNLIFSIINERKLSEDEFSDTGTLKLSKEFMSISADALSEG